MTNKFSTEQEEFWSGEFGEDYIERNTKEDLFFSKNLWFFTDALKSIDSLASVIEFGPNIGANLIALHALFPNLQSTGIEINKKAVKELEKNLPNTEAINESILDCEITKEYELSLIKGVLIHQDPSVLDFIYSKLYAASSKYILVAEYYSPVPVELDYRGNSGKLFKRDFAGEILEKYKDLSLVDYGFAYRNEKKAPQDDISWFLLAKEN